jgi:hypothetical protein
MRGVKKHALRTGRGRGRGRGGRGGGRGGAGGQQQSPPLTAYSFNSSFVEDPWAHLLQMQVLSDS